jgi:hypothetical protein
MFLTALLAAGAVVVPNAGAQSPVAPEIVPARRITFTPKPGEAWNLESSTDGRTWSMVAGPFFGTAGPAEYLAPAGAASQFRLTYVDPATVGHAPLSVTHSTVMMEKAGQPVELVFTEDGAGFLRIDEQHARGFTYTWKKTSPDGGEAILSGRDGSYTLVRLKFFDDHLGQWGMEDIPSPESASLIKVPIDGGAFSYHAGRFKHGPGRAELPLDFDGGSLIFNEGGRLSYVHFTGAEAVKVTTADGAVLTGSYSYDPASATAASLILNMAGAAPLGLNLNLTAPGTGKFKEVPPAGNPGGGTGVPRNGTFTLPDEQDEPDPDCPPPGLGGHSYTINDSTPCTLTFNADGSGVQMREVDGALQITYFNYSYSRTGKNTASVGITYPGAGSDLIDDYQMDFTDDCAGAFRRESYADGNSAGTSDGTFSPTDVAGR